MHEDRSAFLFVFAEPEVLRIERHDQTAQKEVLQKRFSGDRWESQEILRFLVEAEELYFDAVSQIQMPTWSRGRVALVGDAAYCPSLLAGEGSAFAMLGAYILAGELHKADGDYERAFAVYEARLRDFIERKQKAAAGIAGSFVPKTSLGLAARNAILKLTAIQPLGLAVTRFMFGEAFELPQYDNDGIPQDAIFNS